VPHFVRSSTTALPACSESKRAMFHCGIV
jgi:hypothetical protein